MGISNSKGTTNMNNLPEKALKNVAEFLPRMERVLFAVALTAPTASWEACDSALAIPSKASQIVMSNPYYRMYFKEPYEEKWEKIDVSCIVGSLGAQLTDGDVRGILLCIVARKNLKRLHLPPLINIQGHGLSPLYGSKVLEHLNLSMTGNYASPVIIPEPMLSEDAVVPILSSIVGTDGNSLKYLRLPKVWRDKKPEVLTQFFDEYNQVMNDHEVDCSQCNGKCIGAAEKPWVPKEGKDYGVQNFTCHGTYCLNEYCHECEINNEFCPCCEVRYCRSCSSGVKTCNVCNTTGCEGGCKTFYTCDRCGTMAMACEACDDTSYCDSCDQLLCKDCSPFVKCQGHDTCYNKSCLDCLKKDTPAVKQCTSCGKGFCSTGESPECKHMEYCHLIERNVCSDCHAKEHDITKCDLQSIPAELQEFLSDSTDEISFDKMVEFWNKCTQLKFFVSDKDFGLGMYGQVRQAWAASCKLVVEYLYHGEDSKAVTVMFFVGLMKEIEERGPDYIVKALNDGSNLPTGPRLCKDCGWFYGMVYHTTSRDSIINFIQKEIDWTGWKYEGKWFLKQKLSKVQPSSYTLHDLRDIRDKAYSNELKGAHSSSTQMEINVLNLDTGKSGVWRFCEGSTLGWVLKIYATIRINYDSFLGSSMITPPTKYFRVLHKGKSLFLSSAGKKTLYELGIRAGDEITVGGVEPEDNSANTSTEKQKAKSKVGKSKKSKKSKGTKKKKTKQPKVQLDEL